MKYFPKIKGESVYLSPMCSEDIDIYIEWLNDPIISATNDTASRIINKETGMIAFDKLSQKENTFAIVKVSDNQLIGYIGFFPNYIHRSAECGIYIGTQENRNKGYGTEAVKLFLNHCFKTLNFYNIMVRIYSFNKAAIAHTEKIGFKKIGERRSNYFYNGEYHNEVFMDILADEFETQ